MPVIRKGLNMTPEENKAIYRRFYGEFLNQGNLKTVDEVVAPDVVSHSPFPGQKPGAEGLKEAMITFRQAFPDLKAKAEDIIAENDKVVGRFTVTATHKGDFMGIPATGKQVSYEEIVIVRLQDGKIVEHWSVADTMTMMQEIGAVPT